MRGGKTSSHFTQIQISLFFLRMFCIKLLIILKIFFQELGSIKSVRTSAFTQTTIFTLSYHFHLFFPFRCNVILPGHSPQKEHHPCSLGNVYPSRTWQTITATSAEIA